MQRAPFLFLQAAGQAVPRLGDSLVDAVHRVLKGERLKGDAQQALHALVREEALSPQAAYYLGGIQQALNELQLSLTSR